VLLTGATGGIGRAIARAIHRRGPTLLISGRREEELDQIRGELSERVDVRAADLTRSDYVAALAEQAGAVDIFVSNAALPASGSLDDLTPEEIDRALDVNLRAPMQLSRSLAPGMAERGFGRIVFISSLTGKVASPYRSAYAASKFGLRGFALSLHLELRPKGVRVTAVFPSFIRDAGMFADARVRLPWFIGTNTSAEVADVVLRAIDSPRPEIDVAPVGFKIGGRLAAGVAPAAIAAIATRIGGERIALALTAGQRDKR